MIGFRLLVKIAFLELRQQPNEQIRVLIFGAGEAGIITKNALERDNTLNHKIVGFFDDDPKKSWKKN